MHLIKSIQARMQNYTLAHFEKSNYSKKLRQFKDIHKGETCFIIGNGPSLRAEDLEKIHQNNIPSFAFNRIYLMFDKTNWRPTYYVSQDEKTLLNCKQIVNDLKLDHKFFPLVLKYYHNVDIKNAYYYGFKSSVKGIPVFSEDISKCIGNSTTVAYSAAQIAVYMGFKKIYLIGIDHNFSLYKNEKGELVKDETVKDYFTDEYNKDKGDLYIPSLDSSTRAFKVMRRFCDENNIKVYNATRGGKLEVFTRVNVDKILK